MANPCTSGLQPGDVVCLPCEPCPTMCAQAGSNLDTIFGDIGHLLTPLTPAINKVIANSGQPSTQSQIALLQANAAANTSKDLIFASALVVVALIVLHK